MRPTSAHSGLRGPPLSLCDIIQRGYLHQVPLLVSLGVNLEARDATGRTPLMLAAYVHPEQWGVGVARLLIEMGVRMSQRDKHGMNALHHACVYERLELVKVLLNAPDFDLVQCDKYGNTALHYAAMSGKAALVQLLATYHLRYRLPLDKVNKHGRTARDEALHCGSHVCVAILDDAAAGPKEDNSLDENSGEEPVLKSEDGGLVVSSEAGQTFTEGDDQDEVFKVSLSQVEMKTGVDGDPKLTLTRDLEEEGGLFGTGSGGEGVGGNGDLLTPREGVATKTLLSPHHSPSPSERSSDSKTRSTDTTPRARRSGVRRAHPGPPPARRLSAGSSTSSKSAASARKESMLSLRSGVSSSSNNKNTTDTSNLEGMFSSENEAVHVSSEGIVSTSSKPPSLQRLSRRNSALSENTNILNTPASNDDANNNEAGQVQLQTNVVVAKPPPTPPITPVGTRAASAHRLHRREASQALLSNRAMSSSQAPLPYERSSERVIHVASEHDFRNTRQYVLKLTRLDHFITPPAHLDAPSLTLPPVLVGGTSPPSVVQHEEDVTRKSSNSGSWRNNIRFLYRHFEYQCSSSWRDAAKPPPEPLMMIPQFATPPSQAGEEVAEDGKDKKIRRPSSSTRPANNQMNDVSTSSSVKRKPSAKQRKISAIRGRYNEGRRPSSDDSFHSPTVIPPSAFDKPSIMKRYHRRRTTSPPSGSGREGQGQGVDSATVSSAESVPSSGQGKKKSDQSGANSNGPGHSRQKTKSSTRQDLGADPENTSDNLSMRRYDYSSNDDISAGSGRSEDRTQHHGWGSSDSYTLPPSD